MRVGIMGVMDSSYPSFSAGQKVRYKNGPIMTVLRQNGNQVFVEGSGDWYHPTKLEKVKDEEYPIGKIFKAGETVITPKGKAKVINQSGAFVRTTMGDFGWAVVEKA